MEPGVRDGAGSGLADGGGHGCRSVGRDDGLVPAAASGDGRTHPPGVRRRGPAGRSSAVGLRGRGGGAGPLRVGGGWECSM
ncbi:MAG TPA: hypothetical protein DIU14_02420 [Actinobacteria bacterium]|nr:hypothetical protein [Actinomycetota bacterium]